MSRTWSRLLCLELVVLGACISAVAYFAHAIGLDPSPNWGATRQLASVFGGLLALIGIILSLPGITASIGSDRMERNAGYINRAAVWGLLALVVFELFMRVYGFNPVLWRTQTNWFGSVQAAGTSSFLGDEGFALTHYRELGEVATPYDSGENIVILGDSRTEARQVGDKDKYSSVAEELLHQKGVEVNLRNFGRSALAISDYVTHIPMYRELYHPRLFVVQLTVSDLSGSFSQKRPNYFVIGEDQTLQLKHRNDVSGSLEISKSKDFHFNLNLLDYAVVRLNALFVDEEEAGQTEMSDQIAQEEIDLILRAAVDTPVIFILIPTEPKLSGDRIIPSDDRYVHFVNLVRKTPGTVVVDALPEFQKLVKTGYFPVGFYNSAKPDRGHLNRYGNRAVGQLLANAIEQVLLTSFGDSE